MGMGTGWGGGGDGDGSLLGSGSALGSPRGVAAPSQALPRQRGTPEPWAQGWGPSPRGHPWGGAAWDTHRAGTGTPSGLGPGPPAGRDPDPQRAGRRSAAVGSRGRARSRSQEVWTRRQLRKREKKKIPRVGWWFFFSSPFLARNQQVWNNNSAEARGGGGRPRSPFVGHPQEGRSPRWLWGHDRGPESPQTPQISPFFRVRGLHMGGGGTPGATPG